MSGFDFDRPPSPRTNRASAPNGCPTCGGDRLVSVGAVDGLGVYEEQYARCPECNPSPVTERPPVEADAWWKE